MWGWQKSTGLVLHKNAFHSSANVMLHQSKLPKSSVFLPKLHSFWYEFPCLCSARHSLCFSCDAVVQGRLHNEETFSLKDCNSERYTLYLFKSNSWNLILALHKMRTVDFIIYNSQDYIKKVYFTAGMDRRLFSAHRDKTLFWKMWSYSLTLLL